MKLGINTRYAFWFSAVSIFILFTVLSATGLVLWKSSHTLRDRLREGTSENVEAFQLATLYNMAEFLRRELFTPLYELDIESINRTLRDLYRGAPVTSVRITDATGKVLTDGTAENISYGTKLGFDHERLDKTPVLIEHRKSDRRVTFVVGIGGYIAGYGEILFSDEPLHRAIANQDRTVVKILREYGERLIEIGVVWTLLIAVAAVVISFLFSRTLSQPLIALRDATFRFASGDLDYRLKISSHDELGELTEAFNTMAADMQIYTVELANANAWLQKEVEERKQAEQALWESRERLLLAQKAGRVGVFDWDTIKRRGVWTGLEDVFETPDMVQDDQYAHWAKHIHPEDLPRVEAELQQAFEEHRSHVEFDYRYVGQDGRTRWLTGTAQILYSADGTPNRMIGTTADVTEAKEYQQRVAAAKEAAEAANVAKSEFLANMSHEMRTPLAGALGMIDLVLEMEIGKEERQMLEMARRSGQSLLRLISDLLDLSRLEAGILPFERKEFSLSETIKSAIEVVSVQAHEKGLKLLWTMEEAVPEKLQGDEGRLRQVLVNLLGNSVKFTPHGEIEVAVRPFCDISAPGQRFLLFSVRDTGVGIPSAQKERIFGKFVQVDPTSTRKFGGAGLGLALSSQIVGIMGGKIWVDSIPGTGSTFHFTYPLDRD